MNAQEKWKIAYNCWQDACKKFSNFYEIEKWDEQMTIVRREAALERKLEAAQRRIEHLEADLKLAQEQTAECEERREFAARLEFGG